MHLYKMTEWEGSSGLWYCNDIEELGKGSGYWWLPARMMNISPAEYIKWVINTFKPDQIPHSEDGSFVGFAWKNQTQMRKYKNYINALARKNNFIICKGTND